MHTHEWEESRTPVEGGVLIFTQCARWGSCGDSGSYSLRVGEQEVSLTDCDSEYPPVPGVAIELLSEEREKTVRQITELQARLAKIDAMTASLGCK